MHKVRRRLVYRKPRHRRARGEAPTGIGQRFSAPASQSAPAARAARAPGTSGVEAPIWRKALISASVGLFVSLLLSAITVAGVSRGVWPFSAWERSGGDLAFRFASSFAPPLSDDRALGLRFTYVDVDRDACLHYQMSDNPRGCDTDEPATVSLVTDVVRAARAAGARMIIIDFAPWPDPKHRRDLARALEATDCPDKTTHDRAGDTCPWIIAPVFGREDLAPNGAAAAFEPVFNEDPARNFVGGRAAGHLRLAAFATATDATAADGIVRLYPASLPARVVDGQGNFHPIIAIPSAPYLAANLLAGGRRARTADCLFYHQDCSSGVINVGTSSQRMVRIDYHYPSLARAAMTPAVAHSAGERADLERQLRRLENKYQPTYERLDLGKLLSANPAGLRFDRDDLAGRIVVLGSSSPVAQDWAATPMGSMAGGEVIINAIRTFYEIDDAKPQAGSQRYRLARALWEKTQSSCTSALVMVLIWAGIYGAWRARGAVSTHAPKRRRSDLMATLTVPAIFLAGLALIVWIELGLLSQEITEGARAGRPVDILTPIVLVALEGFAEGSVYALTRLEHAFAQAAATLGALGTRLAPRKVPSSSLGGPH